MEEFGDMFVLGARMGGAYYAILEFRTETEEDARNISATLDAAEFGVFATSDKFSQVISSFKGHTALHVRSFRIGGNNEGQETSIDAIVNKARNFASELGERGSPFLALVQDYKSLRLPSPPNTVDIQAAADVLANYAALRSEIVQKINDVEYIQLHPEQFVDVANFDLQGMLKALTDALNKLKRNASTCINSIKDCQFADVTIPTVTLPKRVAGTPPPPPPQLVPVPDLTGTHVMGDDAIALLTPLQLGTHPRNAIRTNDNRRNFEIVNQAPLPTNKGGPIGVPIHTVIEVDFLSTEA